MSKSPLLLGAFVGCFCVTACACSAQCPRGFVKRGDYCHRLDAGVDPVRDGGLGQLQDDENDAEATGP